MGGACKTELLPEVWMSGCSVTGHPGGANDGGGRLPVLPAAPTLSVGSIGDGPGGALGGAEVGPIGIGTEEKYWRPGMGGAYEKVALGPLPGVPVGAGR